jgi:arsenate reductase
MARKDTTTIYHNPRCGKSRDTLAIIRDHGIEPTIIEYLKTPPTKDELRSIVKKLGLKPEQLVRKGEDVYKEDFAGKSLDEEQWLEVLAKNPILIERPIVVRGGKAIIGRPPEKVRELL